MDYHLDHKIQLSDKSEHKSLYKWSLNEVGEDDKQPVRDQIPWVWTVEFTATELSWNHKVKGEDDYDIFAEDEERLNRDKPPAVTEEELIHAVLQPGSVRNDRWEEGPSYSMFGTDRFIENFSLSIRRLSNDESSEDEKQLVESCRAWCIASYTSEIDFSYHTEPDMLGFYLFLKPERFDALANLVRSKQIDQAFLQVGGVSGFYSDWSPSITTRKIKVLGGKSDQEISIPDGCEVEPPRMIRANNVSEFAFNVTSSGNTKISAYFERQAKLRAEEEREQDEYEFEDDDVQVEEGPLLPVLQQIASAEVATRKLKLPLWIGAIAMVAVAYLLA